MNKLMILTIAVIGLGLVSAHAEEMNFDGNTLSLIGKPGFMEAIQNTSLFQNDNMGCERLKPTVVSLGNTTSTVFSPRMAAALDEAIKGVIYSSARYDNKLVKENLEQLLAKGTFEQKYEFVYGAERVYHFPDSYTGKSVAQEPNGKQASAGNMKSLTHACIETVSETLCVDKTVCKYTCVLMGGAAAVYGSVNGVWQIIIPAQIATQVCKDVCENVPLCTTSERCIKWDTI